MSCAQQLGFCEQPSHALSRYHTVCSGRGHLCLPSPLKPHPTASLDTVRILVRRLRTVNALVAGFNKSPATSPLVIPSVGVTRYAFHLIKELRDRFAPPDQLILRTSHSSTAPKWRYGATGPSICIALLIQIATHSRDGDETGRLIWHARFWRPTIYNRRCQTGT